MFVCYLYVDVDYLGGRISRSGPVSAGEQMRMGQMAHKPPEIFS